MSECLVLQINKKGAIELMDENGCIQKFFEIKENLQRALELLKRMNGLKIQDGISIYETMVFEGKSIWAFHQHFIFWNYLRDYVKYEPIIDFLYNKKCNEIKILGDLETLSQLFRISGIKVRDYAKKEKHRKKWVEVKVFFTKSFSAAVTLIAFLKLFFLRTSILIYTPDKYSNQGCDFRFAPVYSYLKNNKISFVEVFHTLLGGEFYKNFFKRKRAAIYLESLTNPCFLNKKHNIGNIDFAPVEKYNIPYINYLLSVINKRSKVSVRLIKVLRIFLRFSGVKKLIAIDDVRYANELVMACKLNKIETYAIQHGQFTKYHVGWMNYGIPQDLSLTFDKLFVWNEYWKKVLLDYSSQYSERNVEVGGWLRKLQPFSHKKGDKKISEISQVNILIPYETSVGETSLRNEINVYIEKFLNFGAHILFHVRPDMDTDKQLRHYGLVDNDKINIIKNIDEAVLSRFDAVAGVYSTFLNEMMYYEKPVFLMKTSFDLGHRLTDDDLAVQLEENFKPEIIINSINNFVSKRNIIWTETHNIGQTLKKIISTNP